jgi:hypothetical protein
MTEPPISLSRPSDLDALQANLVELALGGAIAPEPGVRGWLEAIGVAGAMEGDSIVADEDWLGCSLPSRSAKDLLARTLLRDPLYRLHVDLALGEVVTAVGASGRWSRLEDLLFGELAVLAPRLVALVDLARTQGGASESAFWRQLDPLPQATTATFDERCWGITGAAEAMFPVLRTQYPALASVPVFIREADPLVIAVSLAASAGEAVRVPANHQEKLPSLARQGVPLSWRNLEDGSFEVTLSAPCRMRGTAEGVSTQPYSRGVPAIARQASALLPTHAPNTRASFWEIADSRASGLAFIGTATRDAWPSDNDASHRGLPHGGLLSNLVRSRRVEHGSSDPADDAFRSLAAHPLFGFWVQVLLVEALDRELGEETLLLAPPTHALVEDVEAATRVYYRPRSDAARKVRPLLDLGGLDDVMTRLAAPSGVHPVAALGDPAGPWAMSLALLARVGVAQTRHDRWALSAHALDRLHGGGLMTGVIRRGRTFRERLHEVLEQLWRERVELAPEIRSA